MKPIKTFIIGSRAFFDGIEEFIPKDNDELCIMDEFPIRSNTLNLHIKGKDVFLCRNMNKEMFIKDALDCKIPMRIGRFLVPSFAEYIGLTIEDLQKLQSLIDNIDEKHTYERIIYDSYIKNNGFFLTEEQRNDAFKEYKNKRK